MNEPRPKAIADSPLQALKGNLPGQKKFGSGQPEAQTRRAPKAPVSSAKKGTLKRKEGYWLSADVVERVRNSVDALSGPPHRYTLSGFAEQALLALVKKLEREHNAGKAFPERVGRLRTGRPRS